MSDMNVNWSTTTRILVLIAVIVGGVWLATKIAPVLEALIIASLLAYFLHPAVKAIHWRTRLSYLGAARSVFAGMLVALIALPAGLGTLAWNRLHQLLDGELGPVVIEIERLLSLPIRFLNITIYPQGLVDNFTRSVATAAAPLPLQSIGWVTNFSQNIFWVVLIFVCTYYLLIDGPKLKPYVLQRVPVSSRPEIDRLIDELDAVWRVFLRVQLLIFLILAVLMISGTVAVLWLFHSGLLAFSPLLLILLLIVVYTAAQQVDNLWLRPRWMGGKLNLHSGLVLGSLIGSLALGGVLLALLIVPGLATGKVVIGYVYRKLMDLPAWPEPDDEPPAEEAKTAAKTEPRKALNLARESGNPDGETG